MHATALLIAIAMLAYGALAVSVFRHLSNYETHEFVEVKDRTSKPWVIALVGLVGLPILSNYLGFFFVAPSDEDQFVVAMVLGAVLVTSLCAIILCIPEAIWKRLRINEKVSVETTLTLFRILPWVFIVSLSIWILTWSVFFSKLIRPLPHMPW